MCTRLGVAVGREVGVAHARRLAVALDADGFGVGKAVHVLQIQADTGGYEGQGVRWHCLSWAERTVCSKGDRISADEARVARVRVEPLRRATSVQVLLRQTGRPLRPGAPPPPPPPLPPLPPCWWWWWWCGERPEEEKEAEEAGGRERPGL